MNAGQRLGTCVLAASLVLNALLGVAWSKRAHPPTHAAQSRAPRSPHPSQLPAVDAGPASGRLPVTVSPPQLPWRQVESDDYRVYVANLRATGCPEWLVREILVADVEKLYEQRSEAVSKPREYWMSGRRQRARARAENDQRAALVAEKRALIRELVACDWDAPAEKTWNEDLWDQIAALTVLLGSFAPPKPLQLIGLVEKYEHLSSELKRKADHILLREDEANLQAMGQTLRAELGAVLSPAELEEFELRLVSVVSLMGNVHLEGVELTGAELREMTRLRATFENPINTLVGNDRDLPDEAKEAMAAGIRRLLGEGRFADYERAQEGTYREVLSFTEEHSLPKPVAVQVYDVRSAAEQEVERLKQDQGLTPEQREDELKTVQTKAAEAVIRALGPTASQDYIKHLGGWLESLAKLPDAGVPKP